MTTDIEDWMMNNRVKRIVRMDDGWAVYLEGEKAFGTGGGIQSALSDARGRG